MKRMSSLAYHFGVKLRFYPSSKQKKIIKLNYDAQRFVYNSYVGRNRGNYHAKHYLAVRQYQTMPFAFSILNNYEGVRKLMAFNMVFPSTNLLKS